MACSLKSKAELWPAAFPGSRVAVCLVWTSKRQLRWVSLQQCKEKYQVQSVKSSSSGYYNLIGTKMKLPMTWTVGSSSCGTCWPGLGQSRCCRPGHGSGHGQTQGTRGCWVLMRSWWYAVWILQALYCRGAKSGQYRGDNWSFLPDSGATNHSLCCCAGCNQGKSISHWF